MAADRSDNPNAKSLSLNPIPKVGSFPWKILKEIFFCFYNNAEAQKKIVTEKEIIKNKALTIREKLLR